MVPLVPLFVAGVVVVIVIAACAAADNDDDDGKWKLVVIQIGLKHV